MGMDNKIPIYNISLEDPEGFFEHFMEYISIVKDPAIMVQGLRFAEETKKNKSYFSADQQFIIAPVAIPDILIYRFDEELGEYYVRFSKEVIAGLVEDFNSNPKPVKINMDHEIELKSAFVLENWIIEDSANDKSTKYGFNLPEGTWMAKVKVKDPQEWASIKEEDRASFSLEAFLGLQLSIKEKLKKEKTMEKQNFELPDGKYVGPDGKEFIIKDGKIEVAAEVEAPVEAAAEEPIVEPSAEAAPAVEETPAEEAKIDEEAIMAMIQPKLDEIYKMIADLKTAHEAPAEDVIEVEASKFTAQDSLVNLIQWANK